MSVFDAIKKRRSVKHYDPSHKLSDDELKTLLHAAALAPTSFNMQNRHFVAVVNQEVKDKLKAAAWGQAQVSDASVCFVLAGNAQAFKNTARYLRHAPTELRGYFEPMIGKFYDGKEQLLRDEDCRSISLSAMNIMLMAVDMGLESCPLIGFDPAKVSEILGLPETHVPLMMVVVGKGIKPAQGRMGLLDFEEQVSVDRYGNHTITGEVEG